VKFSKTLIYSFYGSQFQPYRAKLKIWLGERVDSIELFPASEGFFCLPGFSKKRGMLLLLNAGIFLWVCDEFYSDKPRRYTLGSRTGSQLRFEIISTNWDFGDIILRYSTVYVTKTVSYYRFRPNQTFYLPLVNVWLPRR
jgi:hypothetical protein